ncbi:MAG: hypothetical protein VYC39_04190 [Myxococcota bacterium]|nr:hypothetical protein [Myxococcota bacterium]
MPKDIRKSANYFKSLPKADPLANRPTQSSEKSLGENAIRSLLPGWANKPIDTMDDGSPSYPRLPSDEKWEHLLDSDDATDGDQAKEPQDRKTAKRSSWIETLVTQKEANKATSPQSVVKSDAIRMQRVDTRAIRGEWGDPLERLRQVGLDLAENHKPSSSPIFQRTKTEGFSANDYPLPGTSFALLGVRGSFGRQQVATAEVESDRLFYDKSDMRHSGLPDLASAPLTAFRARSLKPGERYRVRSERSILAESGLKYTPIAIPGVSSSMVHDFGPSGQVDFTVAVDSETTLEVIRGFGSKVAVAIRAHDERADPGEDKRMQASVGAFIDGSLGEYLGKSFGKIAGENVKHELGSLEDRKKNIDLKILPHTNRFNQLAGAQLSKQNKSSKSEVTLYEVVFDLANPQARKTFDALIGGKDGQQIDFTALAQLPQDSGVEVVSNHVKTASRKGIEKTFAAFGYEWWHRGDVTEKAEKQYGEKGKGTRVLTENHGIVRRSKIPGRALESTTIARIKTVEKPDETPQTGVGFGWTYSFNKSKVSVEDLAELLSFASLTGADPKARAELNELFENRSQLPRKKLLGIAIGEHRVGATDAAFSVELNVTAVEKLLSHIGTQDGEQKIWDSFSNAYAMSRGQEKAPSWPLSHLDADGVLGGLRRNLSIHGDESSAFLSARSALNLLKQAKESKDPVECAKKMGQCFDLLRNDLALAGSLINLARIDTNEGIDVNFALNGAKDAENARTKRAETPVTSDGTVPTGQ